MIALLLTYYKVLLKWMDPASIYLLPVPRSLLAQFILQ
jgi:hypothetical protein